MIKDKKKFIYIFLISFAVTVCVVCFLIFAVFRNVFYNIYTAKGNAKAEAGQYTQAIEMYNVAKSWKPKKQGVYLSLAEAYAKAEDYDNAGKIIDTAIEKRITTKENGLEQLYIMRIKILSASGKLYEAASYIDSLDDQYILKKIQSLRPDDLSYTPTQGSYDKTLKMKITVRDGETVYYTTDGSYPTRFSNIYVDPINVANGTTVVTAISVNAEGLVSPVLSVSYDVTNENEAVNFDDSKIEKMVRTALSKPNGVIRVKELASVTTLSNEGIDGYVKTLSDLDLMPNLEYVSLENESMLLSISQLSGKTKLHTLILSGCDLDNTDINSLGALTALETLDVSNNSLTSISALSNLDALKYIYLSHNNINDISVLGKAKAIEYIDASYNSITSIPDFENSGTILTLILENNVISDISSIHQMTALTYLDISTNRITNAKTLAKLSNLEELDISNNSVANFDFLSSLTKLSSLNVNSTMFVNTKPLKNLPLTSFYANGTGLANLDDIGLLKKLTTLSIADTNVTKLSPIKDLELIDYIDITNCNVTDASILSSMKGLLTVKTSNSEISSYSFVNKNAIVIVSQE